ncbi:hypothetical protein CRG98_021102 [Punica granatum]|uniref:Uncharacterized protein n=1 Tax=Punica granatum TaxID=22663 RepID=A0A2I0JRH9_PUNGR|nr:hypothetical protein CRG98_021102 [Punica granatum]
MQASKILCISSLFTNPTSELVCFSLIIVPTIFITKSFRPKLVGLTRSRIKIFSCKCAREAWGGWFGKGRVALGQFVGPMVEEEKLGKHSCLD